MTPTLKDTAGFLAIAGTAAIGYLILRPVEPPPERPAPREMAGHVAGCTFCRLPLYGPPGLPSQMGPDGGQSTAQAAPRPGDASARRSSRS